METQTVENDPRVNPPGAKPTLIDAATQTYHFHGGICRELSKVSGPWRIETEFAIDNPIGYRTLSLAADVKAFGIVPGLMPSGNQRSGWGQEKIEALLRSPSLDYWRESIAREAVFEQLAWVPKTPSYKFSESFISRTDNGKSIVLSNAELKTGVYCDIEDPETWPNPRCHGFVFLDADEVAAFKISYDGLVRLDEVVRSIIQQTRAVRTACPAGSKAP